MRTDVGEIAGGVLSIAVAVRAHLRQRAGSDEHEVTRLEGQLGGAQTLLEVSRVNCLTRIEPVAPLDARYVQQHSAADAA